jgi:CheY-like chemotaxis protein
MSRFPGAVRRGLDKTRVAMKGRGCILVVDDDEAIRETLRDCLHDEGYEVHVAANGAQGLAEMALLEHPCVVLLDLMMPVMSGWEMLEAIHDDPRLAAFPVVVISCMAAPGVAGHVQKPIDVDQLLHVVEASRPPPGSYAHA